MLTRAARKPTISEVFADVRAEFIASGMTEEELGDVIEGALSEVRAGSYNELAPHPLQYGSTGA